MKEIELPDGTIAEFPADMPDEQIAAVLRKQFGGQSTKAAAASAPAMAVPFMDRLLQAAKPEMGAFQGLRDPIDAGAQMLVRGANAVGLAPDSEVERVDKINRDAGQNYQQSRGELAGTFDPLRLFGNVLATALMTAAAPVGAGLAARTAIGAATGAGFGALQPVEQPGADFWKQKFGQAKTGVIAGGLAAPITAGLARIISPRTSPDVKALMREGVTPTPGQVLGGAWKTTEDKLTSIPLVGDAIRAGQRRAVGEFDRAALTRVLEPIGKQLPKDKVGREAVRFVGDQADQFYDDALSRVGPIRLDASLSADMTRVLGKLSGTPDKAQQFVNEIQREISNRARNGVLNGRGFKDIESTLGQRAAQYRQSGIASERDLGDAFFEAQKAMREWLQRTAPAGVADDIAKANQSWASLVRVENAAGMQGAKDGIFSPAQLSAGVRRAEKSVRKRGFARGESLMQDLSDSGQAVLSQTIPDSGTPGRLMAAALTGGGLGYISPLALGAAGVASLPYTPVGQRAMAGLLASRPQLAEPVSQAVRQAGVPILTGGLFGLLGQ